MGDSIIEQSSLGPREVGLNGPDRLSLPFSNTEHTFVGNIAGLVIGIGNPNTTPPMLVIPYDNHNIIYCPTGFSYWDGRWLRNVGNLVQASTFGRESYSPLNNAGQIDPFISGKHLTITKEKNGQITVRNMGRNGTSVAEVPMITEMEGGRFYLKRGAVALDARREMTITLRIGGNNEIKLIIGPKGVKEIRDRDNQVVSRLKIKPRKKGPRSLTLGRGDINPNDKTISPPYFSIVYYNSRYYLFDHSDTGTTVEFAEIQPQPPVREERKEKTKVRTPQLILKRVHHREQQIPGDRNSVGGDYYLFGSQVVNDPYLLEKGGNAVVVMDTASIQSGTETPATTTKPFAQKFLNEYYLQIADGKDPETAMEKAYIKTHKSNEVGGRTLGQRTEATFTFVTVVGDTAYCLWVGNTEAVVVRNGEVVDKLATSEGMGGEPYYDPELNTWVSPTRLVESRLYRTSTLELSKLKLLPGDRVYVYVYTDGVWQLNPKKPKFSSLKPDDDAVLVRVLVRL
jgi:hypothetical protein